MTAIEHLRDRARELRVEGKSYSDIATELDIPLERAFQFVREGVKLPPLKTIRETEHAVSVERMDRAARRAIELMELSVTEKLTRDGEPTGELDASSQVKAVNALVAVEARRAKLFGLDAPERVVAAIADLSDVGEDEKATPDKARALIRQKFGLVVPGGELEVETEGVSDE